MRDSDFATYLTRNASMVEIVPWCLFDTVPYISGVTSRLEFFVLGGREIYPLGSNMYMPGVLPNPQAFLIKAIVIYGLPSSLARGLFEFHIGAKLYQHSPAWLMAVRPKWNLDPPIIIPTLTHFRAILRWDAPIDLGTGLDPDQPKFRTPLQVGLLGQLARPIQ